MSLYSESCSVCAIGVKRLYSCLDRKKKNSKMTHLIRTSTMHCILKIGYVRFQTHSFFSLVFDYEPMLVVLRLAFTVKIFVQLDYQLYFVNFFI